MILLQAKRETVTLITALICFADSLYSQTFLPALHIASSLSLTTHPSYTSTPLVSSPYSHVIIFFTPSSYFTLCFLPILRFSAYTWHPYVLTVIIEQLKLRDLL